MALQNRTTGAPPVMNPCLDGDDQKVEPNGGSITSHRRDGLVSLVCLWSCLSVLARLFAVVIACLIVLNGVITERSVGHPVLSVLSPLHLKKESS